MLLSREREIGVYFVNLINIPSSTPQPLVPQMKQLTLIQTGRSKVNLYQNTINSSHELSQYIRLQRTLWNILTMLYFIRIYIIQDGPGCSFGEELLVIFIKYQNIKNDHLVHCISYKLILSMLNIYWIDIFRHLFSLN